MSKFSVVQSVVPFDVLLLHEALSSVSLTAPSVHPQNLWTQYIIRWIMLSLTAKEVFFSNIVILLTAVFLGIPFPKGIWLVRYSISIINQGFVNLKAKWSEQNNRAGAILLRLLNTDHCISLSYRHTHTFYKMVWEWMIWTLEGWQPEDCKGKTFESMEVS